MAETDKVHLKTLTDLEAEVRRRYGRSAPGLLMNLPLDTPCRVRALSHLLSDKETAERQREIGESRE